MSVALLSAVEQLALMQQGKISSLELVEEHIARIERLNPVLNAFVDFDSDRARQQARNAGAGALAGLPLTIKASIATKGYRCEIGSVLQRGDIPQEDAWTVARLRDAGANATCEHRRVER